MQATEPLRSSRLTLTPLEPADAAEMSNVLSDPALYAFTGGAALTPDELEERYRFQVAGSPHPGEIWHNWIVRLDGSAIGYVQATATGDEAELAWVLGTTWQGHGYATEASMAMRDWLTEQGTTGFRAEIHPEHAASNRIAARLGLQPTGRYEDGEMIWASPTS